MRILAWNIQHGGGARLTRVIEEISAYEPDVIALTEYRTGPGLSLSSAFKGRGLLHVETTEPSGHRNGIAVFSRTPLLRRPPPPVPAESRGRWLDIDMPEHGFGIGVLHILASGSSTNEPSTGTKTRFWNAVLRAAKRRLREPFLFVGDLNTGAHRIDEAGKTFVCAEHFGRLSELGWTDMWRHYNRGETEWTWYSKRKGGARCNGFRLDHAFASPSLMPRITSCRYSHRERDAGVSDHSVLILDVNVAMPHLLGKG